MKLSKININLLFLVATAILFQIFLFTQKENFHIDELLSFIAANNDEGIYLSKNWSDTDNIFVEGKDFTRILTKQPNGLSLAGVWKKISQGVHMPVFYVLLNAFYFTGNDSFSPLPGMLLNIVTLFLLLIGFYKLTEIVFKNINIATVVTGIFAFSQAVLSLEVYIRMYLLLMTFSVWLLYFSGTYFLFKKKRDLFFVLILTFLTILTHYYSLIFCFLIAFFVCLYFLLQKEYKSMFVFGFVMLCAVIAAYFSFPTMIGSGFHSERGSQFWMILSEFRKNPLKILRQQIPLFTDTIFMNFWLFGAFVFSFGLCWYKNKIPQNKYILILFFVFLCYGFLTALVMPVMLHYQVRYFAPIIPIFILLISYMIICLGNKYNFSQTNIFVVLCAFMLFLGIKNIIWQDSPFYMHGTRNSRKMENLINGADVWWGFGGGNKYAWMIGLYADKLAKADKTWILADFYHPRFVEFSNQEIRDKKYAYLFMSTTQETNIDGAISWIEETTGRKAYYLFTSKIPNSAAMVFEASVFLVCPF